MSKSITLAVTISRPWRVVPLMDALAALEEVPWDQTQVLILADCLADSPLSRALEKAISFSTRVQLLITDRPPEPDREMIARRKRIADNMGRLLEAARGQYLVALEDDTVFPPDTMLQLLDALHQGEGLGFVQGTAMGRWGVQFCPHWIIEPDRMRTAPWPAEGAEAPPVRIDGGGWYCWASPRDAWDGVSVDYDPEHPLGPDVQFVQRIRGRGYQAQGLWSLQCGHAQHRGPVLWPGPWADEFVLTRDRGRWCGNVVERAARDKRATPRGEHLVGDGIVKVRITNYFFHGGKDMWPSDQPVETTWERAQQWMNRGNAVPYEGPSLTPQEAPPTRAPLKLTPAQVETEPEDDEAATEEESEPTPSRKRAPAEKREAKVVAPKERKPKSPAAKPRAKK